MDPRHAEYTRYYEARYRRVAGHPLYPRSAEAEGRLLELVRGCDTLDELRAAMEREKPELACAIARVLDQAAARAAHFHAMHEPIRARGPERILARAGGAPSVEALTALVSEVMAENGREIAVDLFVGAFADDLPMLEDLEVTEAILPEVPEEWRAELQAQLRQAHARNARHYATQTRPENRRWSPGWELDHGLVHQERHRRHVPDPDDVVERRIVQHRRTLGLE